MAELAGVVSCAAGKTPIVGEVCWVDAADGPPVPMCVAHFQADDCGRHLMEEFGGDPRAAAVLDGLMGVPCPPPRPVADPSEIDAETREALDRAAAKVGLPLAEV